MPNNQVNKDIFLQKYSTVVQCQAKLADTTNMWIEGGRGTGKSTHILALRIDRVQAGLPGAALVLVAATYKSIFDNILPAIMEHFRENYVEGVYYTVGKTPPSHFAPCNHYIRKWGHTIAFVNGCVIQFASIDRPESMLSKNTPHIFLDEMLRIPEEKFIERCLPALRADRTLYGNSHYYLGITGVSSTPNFTTDHDWFQHNEKNMNPKLITCIQNIAYQIDVRYYHLHRYREKLKQSLPDAERKKCMKNFKKCETFINRWTQRVNLLRRNQHFYLRVSSFSNIKILGLDYIKTQQKVTKNSSKFNTSILSVRSRKPKDMFLGKFGKQHLFQDSYNYKFIDAIAAGDYTFAEGANAKHLKHYRDDLPLIAGFDPGPFMSIVFAQRQPRRNGEGSKFRALKNLYVIHPKQHVELAEKIDGFFSGSRRKEIFLHYDRAANQRNPHYRKFYPLNYETELNDTDAQLLKKALEIRGWKVRLMSLNQATIFYWQHYALLNLLFSKPDGKRDEMLIDENECAELVSSINSAPLKKTENYIELDKSSERELEYEDQAMWSTQIFSAYMYLIWGQYSHLLPKYGSAEIRGAGTYNLDDYE
ncbi:MAG: hypothetical protein LBI65_02130 [Candidatus Symbiothrix sp.]|jgi:hypothetical protein|nr:hypothetical protein [Candidatus Symbiothrix sp.]